MTVRWCVIGLIVFVWGCSQDASIGASRQIKIQHAAPVTANSQAVAVDSANLSDTQTPTQSHPVVSDAKAGCKTVLPNDAVHFTGLKVHLSADDLSDWIYLPLVKLEQRKDLVDKPLLVAGHVGQSGRDMVCQRLLAAHFSQIHFVSQQTPYQAVDSYQSLLLLENPLPKMVVTASEHEARTLAVFGDHIQQVDSQEYQQLSQKSPKQQAEKADCKDVYMTRSAWQGGLERVTTEKDIESDCVTVILPDISAIEAEINRQKTANIKRNMPMDKYKCET